uniref:G/T mismatch-specific thymine DNA glycosylase n=1 Tax=Ceratitis capitata TaxID=7213 RepID=W8AKM6_CERCA
MKMQQGTVSDVVSQQQPPPQEKPLAERYPLANRDIHSSDIPNANITPGPYSYMDDNLAAGNSAISNSKNSGSGGVSGITQVTLLNVDCGSQRNSDASAVTYLSVTTNVMGHQVDGMYNIRQQLQNQQPQQQIQVANNELQESVDYNLKMKLTTPAANILSESQQVEQQLSLHHHMQHLPQHIPAQPSQFNFTEHNPVLNPPQKKRGRKKKIPIGLDGMISPLSMQLMVGNNESGLQVGELSANTANNGGPNANENVITGPLKTKERKKHDRFNGMSEEEVVKRTLPDHLCDNLDIVIIGINPGLFAAYKGHHYAGPGNHFWKCLYLSGLTQEQMSAEQDIKLLKYGIGFTNMVQRATKGSADLTRKEIKEGSRLLLEKLQRFRPKIAVFNGKLIFEVFSGKKDFNFGRQPECVEGTDTYVWVMPSSSARCAQLPRAADKVPFYAALKKFRDYLNGSLSHMDESECVFTEQKIKQVCDPENHQNLGASGTSALCGHANGEGIASKSDGMGIEYDGMPIRFIDKDINMTVATHVIKTDSDTFGGICADRTACGSCAGCGNESKCSGRSSVSLVNSFGEITAKGENRPKTRLPRFQDGSTEATYLYRTNENVRDHSMAGLVPLTQSTTSATGSIMQQQKENNMIAGFHGHPPPEKKKRGRPKKIKEHDLIDSDARNRMQIMGQMSNSNDFSNILNLSMMSETISNACGNKAILGGSVGIGNGNGEAPKKKRGRPKKVKPVNDSQQIQNPLTQNIPQAMSIQALTGMDTSLTQRMQNHPIKQQANNIYENKDMQQQQQSSHQLFTTSSPMRSPAINCSYVGITPPTSTQSTPPTHQQHCDKLLDNGSVIMSSPINLGTTHMEGSSNAKSYYTPRGMNSNSSENHDSSTIPTPLEMTRNELGNEVSATTSASISMNVSHETHLGESPPPSSPNICSVDFEPPALSSTINSENDVDMRTQRSNAIQQHSRIQRYQELRQNTRYQSPVDGSSVEHQTADHYQHWLSPHQAISLPTQYTHHQHEQQHQHHHQQQQQQNW